MVELCPICGEANCTTNRQAEETFQYGDGPDAVQLTARFIMYKCTKNSMEFSGYDAEQARDRAVSNHLKDVQMLAFLKQFKPCPFCGYKLEHNLDDSFHPSGRWWRQDGELRVGVMRESRKSSDNPIYDVHCPECSGGCGITLTAHTKEEALEKWNRRVQP